VDPYDLSFVEAQAIARAVPESVMIGGWAVWCFNHYLKSRDIDLLVATRDSWRLDSYLRGRGFVETSGTHLRKRGYRLLHEDVSIDVDVYENVIGPYGVNELIGRWRQAQLGETQVRVLRPTELLVLKIAAAGDRRGSEKGAKDLGDLLALLSAASQQIDWEEVRERIPRGEIRTVLRTALSEYNTASRLYPMALQEYRRLKRSLDRRQIL
jgi:predicted nucleotidyltransferase